MRTLLGLTLSWTLFLPLLFSEVRQAHVDPRTITLPVVDGKGIRFTRLSTDEGLSQTKVTHMVQDDQGFMWFGTQYGLNRTTATPSNCSFAIREIPTASAGYTLTASLRIAMARSGSDAINFSINSTERPRRLHGIRCRSSPTLVRTAPEHCGWQLSRACTV